MLFVWMLRLEEWGLEDSLAWVLGLGELEDNDDDDDEEEGVKRCLEEKR
jgi:hypothetical protein